MTCLIHSYKLQRKWGQHIRGIELKENQYSITTNRLCLFVCEKSREKKK